MLELLIHQPIFIGFKADSTVRKLLESLGDSDKKYISAEDPAFLRICRVGEDIYVGKLIRENLTTDQVDDIRRNVLSIMQRLKRDWRLPSDLKIFACSAVDAEYLPTGGRPVE